MNSLNTRRSFKAFTLIELLVVIAIIAILAAILFPVFAQARDKARQTSCLSNIKQIGTGLMMYVQDFDETYPGALQAVPVINGGTTADQRIPIDMQLMPYTKNDQIWTCPSDAAPRVAATNGSFQWWDGSYRAKAIPRSYGYVAEVHTQYRNNSATSNAGLDSNTGLSTYKGRRTPGEADQSTGKALAEIDAPSNTIALVEIWAVGQGDFANLGYVGGPHAATVTNCDTWKLAGRTVSQTTGVNSLPTSCSGDAYKAPTKGHQNQANYLMADGSAKVRRWGDVRQNDFYLFKLKKPTATFTP